MSVWTSAGAESRSAAELGLLNMEQANLVKQSNLAATQRIKEKDALCQTGDEYDAQKMTKYYQTNAADAARDAALIGAVTALAGAISGGVAAGATIAKSASTGLQIAASLTAAVTATFGAIGAFINYYSTAEEAETLKKQTKALEVKASDETMRAKALDANPSL